MPNNSAIITLGTVTDTSDIRLGRTSAGTAIIVDDTQILIDPGVGAIVRLSQASIDINNTQIILCSSSDTGETNDLNAILESIGHDVHLICPKEIAFAKNHKHVKILQVEEDKLTHIKNIDINAYYQEGSISFKLTTPRFVLGYINKAKYSKSLLVEFDDTNIFIIGLYNIKKEKNNYLSPEDIIAIASGIGPELVILNNFSKKSLESDPLDISRNMKLGLNTKTQIIPAKELMAIVPEIYNVKLKQKRLKGYF